MSRRSAGWPLTLVLLAVVGLAGSYAGAKVGRQYERNRMCCQTPQWPNVGLSLREVLGLVRFPSQIGQDKWVLYTVFPGVTDGFFLDVGSADGYEISNTVALEQRGWTGICIDPFPTNMQGRTCRMLKEVVFSDAGRTMKFQDSGGLGGITDTLGARKADAMQAPTVTFTTTTLRDLLRETKAPRFIHFVSLDIEGAELEALKAFPFETHRIGALAVEHNDEQPKRDQIAALLATQGYVRTHSWHQDDFYIARPRP